MTILLAIRHITAICVIISAIAFVIGIVITIISRLPETDLQFIYKAKPISVFLLFLSPIFFTLGAVIWVICQLILMFAF